MVPRQLPDQLHVQRLGETRIGDGCRQAEAGKLLGRLQTLGQPRAKEKSATVEPSRTTRPLPIGSTSPRSGSATPVPSPRG